MTWNADTLAALITEPESLEDLVTVLDDLTEADRSVIRKAIGKALPSLRRRMEKVGAGGQRLVLLAVAVGATPAQCAKVFSSWDIWRLMQVPITRDRLLSWMTGNGPEWAGDLITRMLKRRTADSMYYTELIDELALDIPIPDDPVFLTAWAVENSSFPRPGHRWEKHLIAACAAPNALGRRLVADQRTQIQAQIREAVADLRVTEPTDDDALLLALLQVFERGDNHPSQQFALILIAGLGLTPLLAKHSDRFLAALPNADPIVVKFAVEQLLPPGLDEDHLTTLALDVLARKEKGVKRAVLKALRSVNDPSQDLVEMLTATTTGPDSTTAELAQKLLDDWGVATGPAESLGLWRDPLGIPPEPIDDLDRLLDEVEFNELIHRLDSDAPGNWVSVEVYERGLAALVALGWAEGRDAVVETLHDKLNPDPNTHGVWKQLVQRWLQRVTSGCGTHAGRDSALQRRPGCRRAGAVPAFHPHPQEQPGLLAEIPGPAAPLRRKKRGRATHRPVRRPGPDRPHRGHTLQPAGTRHQGTNRAGDRRPLAENPRRTGPDEFCSPRQSRKRTERPGLPQGAYGRRRARDRENSRDRGAVGRDTPSTRTQRGTRHRQHPASGTPHMGNHCRPGEPALRQ